MYLCLDEKSQEIIKNVENETMTRFDKKGDFIEINEDVLIEQFDYLLYVIEELKEEIKTLKQPNDYNPEIEIPDPRYE